MIRESLIIKTAKETIDIEQQTIENLKNSIDKDFVSTVDIIYNSKGRLVIAGIGKSAIIAQKIVATLNSTGTQALFMHAADAIHGDLGMIRPEDVVLCISKSGNTSEIKVLVPFVKNLGYTLVGMTSNKDSYLGRNADFVLHTPISKEADPNNLAPTSSTTAQIVMGDAIATALLALRGFTPKDFAQFHPGGALGKQLYLKVADIYTQNEKPKVLANTDLRSIILEMTKKRMGATAVTDETGRLLGIITDGDLRRMLTEKEDVDKLTAKDIMTANPKSIEANMLAVGALDIMRKQDISQLIVVEKGQYLGMIHLHDLIREGLV